MFKRIWVESGKGKICKNNDHKFYCMNMCRVQEDVWTRGLNLNLNLAIS